MTTASLVSISSSVLGGVLAVSVPGFCTAQLGAPSPMCGAAGIALAGATQLLVSLLIIPELFRISGGDIEEQGVQQALSGPDPELALIRLQHRAAVSEAFETVLADLSARERNVLRLQVSMG